MASSRGPTVEDKRSGRLEIIKVLLQASRTVLLIISIFMDH